MAYFQRSASCFRMGDVEILTRAVETSSDKNSDENEKRR